MTGALEIRIAATPCLLAPVLSAQQLGPWLMLRPDLTSPGLGRYTSSIETVKVLNRTADDMAWGKHISEESMLSFPIIN